ncbi:hypothetical protein M422DRAFT_263412 [Sphaerobolus stellatus SS14]|uniref:Uncharacterized protein n=1 Tax=Sphaerobolus stellatus (strain SS14) TaxID=990650 RepID=A0A0C9UYW2_SPHS4|nr:hypothetical protein M422DRAFT_263412 [Sphaerobolus stellatus SS14]
MATIPANENSTTTVPSSSSRTANEQHSQRSQQASSVETLVSEWRMNVEPTPIPRNTSNDNARADKPVNPRRVVQPEIRQHQLDVDTIPTGSDILSLSRATVNTERLSVAGSSVLPSIFEHIDTSRDSSGLGKSSVKIVAPERYDGRADIEVFEQWGLELNNYYQLTGMEPTLHIRHLPTFVKGKAAYFYRTYVAHNPEE